MFFPNPFLACAAALVASLTVTPVYAQQKSSPTPTLRSVATITVPNLSERGFLSISGNRLYIATASAGTLSVIDLKTKVVITTIRGLPGVRGFVAVPEEGIGFATVGVENKIAVIDLATNEVRLKLEVGLDPEAIVYAAKRGLVYIGNCGNSNVTLIDPKKLRVVKSFAIGGTLADAIADPQTGLVYQTVADRNEVAVVDVGKRAVAKRLSVSPGVRPTALAVDSESGYLYVASGNGLLNLVFMDDGKVKGNLKIGAAVTSALYDPLLRRAYTVNSGDGTLTIIEQKTPGNWAVCENFPLSPNCQGVAIDPQTHRIYVLHVGGVDVLESVTNFGASIKFRNV